MTGTPTLDTTVNVKKKPPERSVTAGKLRRVRESTPLLWDPHKHTRSGDMKTDLLSSDSAPLRCLTLFPSYSIERQRCSRILRRRCMLP